jgi:hypothetical protein
MSVIDAPAIFPELDPITGIQRASLLGSSSGIISIFTIFGLLGNCSSLYASTH